MGYVAWHSRSIFASMLMHFANNAFVVLLLWQPGVRRAVLSGGSLSWPLVAGGVVLLSAGIWLLPRRLPEPQGLSS
jgi:membrane protease YdiL (CAAX protease family)